MKTQSLNCIFKFAIIILASLGLILNPLTYIMPSYVRAEENDGLRRPQVFRRAMPWMQEEPEYAPGELIVKMREGKGMDDVASLNAKYAVSSQDKLFSGPAFPDPEQELNKLKNKLANLGSEHEGWYWQTDKESQEYKDYLAKIEKEKEALNEEIKNKEEGLAKEREEQGRISRLTPQERPPNLDQMYFLKTEDGSVDTLKMSREYSHNPNVEYAEPNYKVTLFGAGELNSGEIAASNPEWNIKKIQADKAGSEAQGAGIVVAVIDSGVNYNHPELWKSIWVNPQVIKDRDGDGVINLDDCDLDGDHRIGPEEIKDNMFGWDFSVCAKYSQDKWYECLEPNPLGGDNDPMDGGNHGTLVAGIISAAGNNTKGVVGVAPQAKIMVLRAGHSNESYMKAVRYAVDHGAQVINNSWGGQDTPAMREVFKYAYTGGGKIKGGCVSVAAAGNNADEPDYTEEKYFYTPASLDTVIAVSATDKDDKRCSWSNYGKKIEIAAPGGEMAHLNYNVYGPVDKDMYATSAVGTSGAGPHIAGVAALILSKNPNLKNYQVRSILQLSADHLGKEGRNVDFGYGRVNAYEAVKLAPGYRVEISSPIRNKFIRDNVIIKGSADLADFQSYELYYTLKDRPEEKRALLDSPATRPVQEEDGVLGTWPTKEAPEGGCILTLKVNRREAKPILYSIEVNIDNISEAPVFSGLGNKVILIDREFDLTIVAKDQDDPNDPDGRGKFTITASGAPSGADFKFDPERKTASFIWTPHKEDKGKHKVTFTATDGLGLSVSKEITISVGNFLVKETQITSDPAEQLFPRIYGDKIVWTDWRNSKKDGINGGFNNADIYSYDLKTGKEKPIDTSPDEQLYADISGNRIVWLNGKIVNMCGDGAACPTFFSPDFSVYDITTGNKTAVKTHSAYGTGTSNPNIFGDKFVWVDFSDINTADGGICNPDIYVHDLINNSEVRIGADIPGWYDRPTSYYESAIYENKIAWVGVHYGEPPYKLSLYDIKEKKETLIDIAPPTYGVHSVLLGLRIYGDKAVFAATNSDNAKWNIRICDLKDGSCAWVSPGDELQLEPLIFKDKVFWIGWRDGTPSIYMYDLLTKEEARITNDDFSYTWGAGYAVYGNTIVWADSRNTPVNTFPRQNDIYMAKILYPPKVSSIRPAQVEPGDFIVILGENFYEPKVMLEPDTIFEISRSTENEIVCKVPRSIKAKEGILKVSTEIGFAKKPITFMPKENTHEPVANDINNSTDKNTAKAIALYGEDKDEDELSFILDKQSKQGGLISAVSNVGGQGTETVWAEVTYTPPKDYLGEDSFTFKVNDGKNDSNIGEVSIQVRLKNNKPTVSNISEATNKNIALPITLSAEDIDKDKLSFMADKQSKQGGLISEISKVQQVDYKTTAEVAYTPPKDYIGEDSFSFKVSDDRDDSETAQVKIKVESNNKPPKLEPIGDRVVEPGDVLEIQLQASDPDNKPEDLYYTYKLSVLDSTPVPSVDFEDTKGKFSWLISSDIYVGRYELTFRVYDKELATDSQKIIITVNRPKPLVLPESITAPDVNTNQGPAKITLPKPGVGRTSLKSAEKFIKLALQFLHSIVAPEPAYASEPGLSKRLTYIIVDKPKHGVLFPQMQSISTDAEMEVTYTPEPNYRGPDAFSFKVNDGYSDSNISTVSFMVIKPNSPPKANSQILPPVKDKIAIELTAVDEDKDTLSFIIVTAPTSGTLSPLMPVPGEPKAITTYFPNPGFIGNDSFTFKASDSKADSNLATVSFKVGGNRPVAYNQIEPALTVAQGQRLTINLMASDEDKDKLDFEANQPANGIVTRPLAFEQDGKTYGQLTYSHNPGFTGIDSFTFKAYKVKDKNNFASARVNIKVIANRAPVFIIPPQVEQQVYKEKKTIAFSVSAQDPDKDPVTITAEGEPLKKLGATFKNNTFNWTPQIGQGGTYPLTFTADDKKSKAAQQTIVLKVNKAPIARVSSTPVRPAQGKSPFSVQFSSAGSFDPDGEIVKCEWSFGGGGRSNQPNPIYTYINKTNKQIKYAPYLIITDNNGATGRYDSYDALNVTVLPQ